MNIIKKTKEHTTKLSMSGKIKKSYRIYCMVVVIATLIFGASVTAFAANDPIAVINNLSGFIFGLIRAVGLILLGFGVVQVGLSLKSHDPSQRANGFLTLAGGVIITLQKTNWPLLSRENAGGTGNHPFVIRFALQPNHIRHHSSLKLNS